MTALCVLRTVTVVSFFSELDAVVSVEDRIKHKYASFKQSVELFSLITNILDVQDLYGPLYGCY